MASEEHLYELREASGEPRAKNILFSPLATTRFTNLPRLQAVAVLLAASLALAWCMEAALFPKPAPTLVAANGSDLSLYRHIIERVHAGEDYYDAAGDEMRAAGYPTGSVFNWRPPLYAWMFAELPSLIWGQVVLALLAVITMALCFALINREGGAGKAVAAMFPLIGSFHWCIDGDAFLSQELWSGILIALSVCAYGRDQWRLGMAAGVSALFFRELALPYCLIAFVIALWRQRRGEVRFWLAGLLLYMLYMGWHTSEVTRRILPGDRLHASWVQFGGATFLLATCRMNSFLFNAPSWVNAIYLPMSLLGLAAWRGPTGTRVGLTAGAYVAAFSVVGQPFNDYWGLLDAPLLALGIIWAPSALRDLCMAVRRHSAQNDGCGME